jgi:hypothetical protein
VSQHIAVERIKGGIVEIRLEHALTQIIEHHRAGAAAETAKGFFMEFGPGLRTGTKDQQANGLAAVTEGQHEQPSAPVFAGLVVAHHGTGAVIDLGLFTWRC